MTLHTHVHLVRFGRELEFQSGVHVQAGDKLYQIRDGFDYKLIGFLLDGNWYDVSSHRMQLLLFPVAL